VYTQCSKCETVFKLSAEVLRAAGGQVRCGKCGEVFNALARLAEDSSAFETGESPLDLEARADSILETIVEPPAARPVAQGYEDFALPPGVEIAQLEVLDWTEEDQARQRNAGAPGVGARDVGARDVGARDVGARDVRAPDSKPRGSDAQDASEDSADRSMEFTLPPGELDRIFVESKKTAAQPATQAVPPTVAPDSERELPPHPESAVDTAASAPSRVSGLEVPEHVRRDMLEGFEQQMRPAGVVRNGGRRGALRRPLLWWLGAAIVSTLLLITQIVQQNREWFIARAHGPFGAGVRALYGALGSPLPAPANLSAYQLRQWGVTGDPDANGTLRLRASILNAAAQLQPYPLLRVTLADRFGKGIGRRDFEPTEYLGKPTARLLAPGERVDATLEILDPGKNAEGFEIDVCLRGVDQRIACQGDAAPQAKR
jgi:predicted Zn finger-like uncharacterized protein